MYNAELVLQERHGIAYALINSKLCSLCSDRMDTMHSPKYRLLKSEGRGSSQCFFCGSLRCFSNVLALRYQPFALWIYHNCARSRVRSTVEAVATVVLIDHVSKMVEI